MKVGQQLGRANFLSWMNYRGLTLRFDLFRPCASTQTVSNMNDNLTILMQGKRNEFARFDQSRINSHIDAFFDPI